MNLCFHGSLLRFFGARIPKWCFEFPDCRERATQDNRIATAARQMELDLATVDRAICEMFRRIALESSMTSALNISSHPTPDQCSQTASYGTKKMITHYAAETSPTIKYARPTAQTA